MKWSNVDKSTSLIKQFTHVTIHFYTMIIYIQTFQLGLIVVYISSCWNEKGAVVREQIRFISGGLVCRPITSFYPIGVFCVARVLVRNLLPNDA